MNQILKLREQVEILANLIDSQPNEKPPYELRQKIYQLPEIEDKSFMDLVIKKVDSILEVVIGNQFELDVNPSFITRSSSKSKIF